MKTKLHYKKINLLSDQHCGSIVVLLLPHRTYTQTQSERHFATDITAGRQLTAFKTLHFTFQKKNALNFYTQTSLE